jgi:tRNA (guanine-N7-)-methyltransferase
MTGPPRAQRTYGRIKARPIKPRQGALLDSLLPKIAVPDGPVDPHALMPAAEETWLEIGFGGGEHLAAQARAHPHTLIIGAEPFLNGAASALRHLDEMALGNVRLHVGDGRDVLSRLPAASLERIYVLFPDPWQKLRHHKRRLLQDDVVADMGRALGRGGRLRFATDWADYADWTLERLIRSPLFDWPALCADDWRRPWPDHVTTRYEQKHLGDCAPVYLEFVRR